MHPRPLVTVLMPVYNAGPFVADAIRSILEQTLTDFEFLAIDDGSTDGSGEVVCSFSDPRIRYVRQEVNRGLVPTLNHGIDLARGSYIARMDADDLCEPERLACQAELLYSQQGVGVCSTWARFIDEHGKTLCELRTPAGTRLTKLFWRPSPIVHAACMVRSDVLRDNRYDPDYNNAEDYELWLRLFGKVEFANIDRVLYSIRRHDRSVSASRRESQLHNSYKAFTRFIGQGYVSYDDFLALLLLKADVSPMRRLLCYLRASRRTGIHLSSLIADNRSYLKLWLNR